MLRSLFLLSGLFFLIGCESDFDKCMNAELPRAEAGFAREMEEAEEYLTAIAVAESTDRKLEEILKPVHVWIEKNPWDPPYPPHNCEPGSEDWGQCDEAHSLAVAQWETDVKQPWLDLRDAEVALLIPALNEAGFAGSNYEEVWDRSRAYYKPYFAAAFARAKDLDCWGETDCDDWPDGYYAEEAHVFGENFDFEDRKSAEWKEWAEGEYDRVRQHFTDKIASIKAVAVNTATLMCNRAGIYE